MRIFLAGATGVVGRRLVPLLCDSGHSVCGITRFSAKARELSRLGIEAMAVDVFDVQALSSAVLTAKPEIVIHQLTDLPRHLEPAQMGAAIVRNARIRDEGTRNLVQAAVGAGVHRFIAQSIAWAYAPGPLPHGEDYPLDASAEGPRAISVGGVMALERHVLQSRAFEGVVLRYGQLYGPGTGTDTPAGAPPVHVDAAAYAALLAIDHGEPGPYNITELNPQVSAEKAVARLGWRSDFRGTRT